MFILLFDVPWVHRKEVVPKIFKGKKLVPTWHIKIFCLKKFLNWWKKMSVACFLWLFLLSCGSQQSYLYSANYLCPILVKQDHNTDNQQLFILRKGIHFKKKKKKRAYPTKNTGVQDYDQYMQSMGSRMNWRPQQPLPPFHYWLHR